MTSRLRIGVFKGRPAAMIFAILCAVIVFAGGPTKALATTNFIVEATVYTDKAQCTQFFQMLRFDASLTQVKKCDSGEPLCHRHLSSSNNIDTPTVRNAVDALIIQPLFNNMHVNVASGSDC